MSSDQIRLLNVYGEVMGKLAVILCMEALKRPTKSVNDQNGFPTLPLIGCYKQKCFAAAHAACRRFHDPFVNIFRSHSEVIAAVSQY